MIIIEMSTFLGILLNKKKKEENRSFHNWEIGYLSIIFNMTELTKRDLDMVFKQSFEYLKNEKK